MIPHDHVEFGGDGAPEEDVRYGNPSALRRLATDFAIVVVSPVVKPDLLSTISVIDFEREPLIRLGQQERSCPER